MVAMKDCFFSVQACRLSAYPLKCNTWKNLNADLRTLGVLYLLFLGSFFCLRDPCITDTTGRGTSFQLRLRSGEGGAQAEYFDAKCRDARFFLDGGYPASGFHPPSLKGGRPCHPSKRPSPFPLNSAMDCVLQKPRRAMATRSLMSNRSS